MSYETGWRFYIQTEVKRFVFWGKLVWRDVSGPYFELSHAKNSLRGGDPELGKEEVVS